MKYYDKNKEPPSYVFHNLYGLAMFQKLSLDSFKQVEEASQFNADS